MIKWLLTLCKPLAPYKNEAFDKLHAEILENFETYKTLKDLSAINGKLSLLIGLSKEIKDYKQLEKAAYKINQLVNKMEIEVAILSYKA